MYEVYIAQDAFYDVNLVIEKYGKIVRIFGFEPLWVSEDSLGFFKLLIQAEKSFFQTLTKNVNIEKIVKPMLPSRTISLQELFDIYKDRCVEYKVKINGVFPRYVLGMIWGFASDGDFRNYFLVYDEKPQQQICYYDATNDKLYPVYVLK
jgi:hypothetical protein